LVPIDGLLPIAKSIPNFCQPSCLKAFAVQAESTDHVRFWAKVNKNGPIQKHCPELGPCWVWTAVRDKKGYGRFGLKGRMRVASRVILAWRVGRPLTKREWALHACDGGTSGCVRPDHLYVGSPRENVDEMIVKDRKKIARGASCARTVLTDSSVREIKALLLEGCLPVKQIATLFQVTTGAIYGIRSGASWKHVA
jgi:hypothetical protein